MPRAWAALWSIASHQELPDEMPEDYPPKSNADVVADRNRRTVEKLLERLRE